MDEKKYEKTSKLHLIFPVKFEEGLDENERHDKEVECLVLLDKSPNLQQLEINLSGHEHKTNISYKFVYGKEWCDYHYINEKAYNKLISNGTDPKIFEKNIDNEIVFKNRRLGDILVDNGLISLKDNERLYGSVCLYEFCTPYGAKRGEFFEGFY